ncbi:MAG TPA: adenylate/guanylate cyclase domain-containing protein [Candidatus Tectomicrobia bacterium]
MEFAEVLEQTIALLQRQGRVSYGALKRRFQLDDTYLEDLKVELIEAQQLAYDENGRILVWAGATGPTSPSVPETATHLAQPALPPVMQVDPLPQGEPPPVTPRLSDAERRQLTVLFCDLVDSTRLSSQLDPEDYREVVRAYQEASAAVIQRFDGYIAQYLGDGLLVYFGYPQAHEDDAQRAVHTGLGIVAAIGVLNTHLESRQGVRLAVRVGVHTGLVVVGEIGGGNRQENLALGETPNMAARLQGLAAPDTVAISAATFRLVRGYFTAQDLGAHALKGVTAALQAYRILGESAAQSRLDVAGATGLTPLVGRESEVTLLLERWAQSQEGRGQMVLLRGEAGIGKSRLVEVLHEHVIGQGATRIAFRCSPYHQNSALYPVIDHLQRFLQWQRDDAPETKLDRLEQVLRTYCLPLEEVVPLFAALLSVPLSGRYPPLQLTPQRQRQKTHEALTAWLLEEAERQPVLAVWEDLHWADPSTLDALDLALDQVPTARMLILLTCRPEFQPPWVSRSSLTQITIGRLGRPQVEAMLRSLTGGKPLPVAVIEQVIAKTDGVPLFVEELVKMILESGLVREEADHYVLTGPLPPLAIPSTLHDSLMARLDRLSAARELAQLGAVLGWEFAYELLQAVSPLAEAMLQQGLAQLVDAELIYQRGLPPRSRYVFKHALIQDAAYQSLLRSTRQQYHQHIAEVLEAQFPETVETQPELVAHHYTEAGLATYALPYWQQAGQRATERSAHVEAIGHLTQGLEILKTLPDTPERARRELEVQILLGLAFIATRGQAAPEVGRTYSRARELCQQVEDVPQLFRVVWGLWHFHAVRAEFQTVRGLSEELLMLAQHLQDPTYLLGAHWGLAADLSCLGEFALARGHWQQSIALYDPQQHHTHTGLFGWDLGVFGRIWAPHTLWHLGYPDQALVMSREGLALAHRLSHPFSLAVALAYTAMLQQFHREPQAVYEQAEAAIALCTEQGFAYYLAWGTTMQGWAQVMQGQGEVGIAQIRRGLAALRATGAALRLPYYLALLAEACGQTGQAAEGLALLAEALALVDTTGEHWWEAELQRLRGELLLHAEGGVRKAALVAEKCFQQALAITRRQRARSLELRAAMSLSRLWQQQGKRTEAHQLLAGIYGRFTEGFDTADLQEAKALLQKLIQGR